MKLILVREGSVKLKIPAAALKPPHKAEVFFNPNMAENRSVSSLALGACLPLLDGSRVLDAFCASGARGIRYALENELEEVIFLDANPDAIKLARSNARLNKLRKVSFFEGEFKDFDEKVDVVEVDPFGTPAPFIGHALDLVGSKGLLSVTATDLATLCGRNNKPVERRYGAKTLYLEYSHEIALRIILGKIVGEANACGFKAKPLFSFYKDHYVKVFVLVGKGKQKQKLGFISHCFKCGNRIEGKKAKCDCGHAFKHAGPLWTRETSDLDIIGAMKKKTVDEKTVKFLDTLAREQQFPPYFFDVHKTVKRTGTAVKPMAGYLEKLKEKGFRAERTHYAPTAFKTNAPFKDVLAVF